MHGPVNAIRTPSHERWLLAGAVALAVVLLSIGISDDYRLKHEDNNEVYSIFARGHLHLGLGVTGGQDFWVKKDGTYSPYGHHPGGPGLLLAAVFAVTGHDGPVTVRSVAIVFYLLALWLLYRLLRRLLGPPEALAGAYLFALLPMGAFYGRMVVYEPLSLPAMIFLVDRYQALSEHGGRGRAVGLVLAVGWGALMGWVTFFVAAACGLHALVRLLGRRPRAGRALALLSVAALGFFALDLLHLAWALGGDTAELQRIFFERVGVGKEYGPGEWLEKMLSFHRRLFTVSGTLAGLWLAIHLGGCLRHRRVPETAVQMAAIFYCAGGLYAVLFNWGAWQHHYWQMPLLPGVVLAMVLAGRRLLPWAQGRRGRQILVALLLLEILLSSAIGLARRHTQEEPYALETVERLRATFL